MKVLQSGLVVESTRSGQGFNTRVKLSLLNIFTSDMHNIPSMINV